MQKVPSYPLSLDCPSKWNPDIIMSEKMFSGRNCEPIAWNRSYSNSISKNNSELFHNLKASNIWPTESDNELSLNRLIYSYAKDRSVLMELFVDRIEQRIKHYMNYYCSCHMTAYCRNWRIMVPCWFYSTLHPAHERSQTRAQPTMRSEIVINQMDAEGKQLIMDCRATGPCDSGIEDKWETLQMSTMQV